MLQLMVIEKDELLSQQESDNTTVTTKSNALQG